jgi:hypothetical protein
MRRNDVADLFEMVKLDLAGFRFFDFIPAEWQVSKQITSHFYF